MSRKKDLKCVTVIIRWWTDYKKPGKTCHSYGVVQVPSQPNHGVKSKNRLFNSREHLDAKIDEVMKAAGIIL